MLEEPGILQWQSLSAAQRRSALERPAQRQAAAILEQTRKIIAAVRRGGDAALAALTLRLDGARVRPMRVTAHEFAAARAQLSAAQIAAIERAIDNVRRFHAAQASPALRMQISPGLICERLIVPIGAVGLYVPAGLAPLPSTAIMLAVPAAVAGCPVRVLATAPRADGSADPGILVAAQLAGIEQVFKVGGAQAIAAMAYGTESVPKCDKIFGPGNAWVMAAKQLVSQDAEGAASDLPAGPTEVMVITDRSASARFAAADLLAQAEHGPDAQSILLSTSATLTAAIAREIATQRARLSRREILDASLLNLRLIAVPDLATAFDIANQHAPEHLLLQIEEPRRWLAEVQAAGAVFLGPWSSETMGDYCSGPNHTLPTAGFAKSCSGLGLEDFQKRITVQEISGAGLAELGPTARILAELEGLDAHAAAVGVRLAALTQGAP